MQTAWKVTEADRDDKGSIKVASDEPRSLADLLPKPEKTINYNIINGRQPWTRSELATLAAVALLAAFVVIYAWATPSAPVAERVARPTLIPTLAATSAPTSVGGISGGNIMLPPAPTTTPVVPTLEPAEPAPVAVPVAAPAACTRDIAPYVVSRRVMLDSLPIGEVTGFSCASAAEAEAAAAAQEQQVHASYQATTTAKTSEAGR
mgnify:CR=1 FL=1